LRALIAGLFMSPIFCPPIPARGGDAFSATLKREPGVDIINWRRDIFHPDGRGLGTNHMVTKVACGCFDCFAIKTYLDGRSPRMGRLAEKIASGCFLPK